MKHELGVEKPEGLREAWPGQYRGFMWLDHVVTAPGLCTLITTRKPNGAPNASFHAWGMLLGDRTCYSSLLAMGNNHTYANILRDGEWCVNLPSFDIMEECFRTIECNGPDNNEISDAGLTVEAAQVVSVPRVAECPISLECRLEWHRPLAEGSSDHILCGRVVHAAIDDGALALDQEDRLGSMKLMYFVRGTLNPITRQTGPVGCLASLGTLVRRQEG